MAGVTNDAVSKPELWAGLLPTAHKQEAAKTLQPLTNTGTAQSEQRVHATVCVRGWGFWGARCKRL